MQDQPASHRHKFAPLFERFVSLLFLATMYVTAPAWGQTLPTVVAETAFKPVSIEESDRALRDTARLPGSGARASLTALATTTQPVEIGTLAASLGNDPDLIFEYVYNNIEYEPLFGSNKGPLGTLLDGRGNDIDQAQLFVALLNANLPTPLPVAYCYGYIRLNSTDANASTWLGVANDNLAIQSYFSNGGIPNANLLPSTQAPLTQLDVAHVWVQVNLSGTALPAGSCSAPSLPANTYVFDPSFKPSSFSNANFATIMSAATTYSKAAFLGIAGGATSNFTSANIQRTATRNALASYAGGVVGYLKAHPTLTVADVVGGSAILPLTGSPLRNITLPHLSPSQPSGGVQTWGTAVPNDKRTFFKVTMPGRSGSPITFYSDQVYGQRITVFSTPSGSNFVATLLVAGQTPGSGTNTSTPAVGFGTSWGIGVAITHPYTGSLATAANQSTTLNVAAGGSYVISNGWGGVGRGMVEKHRQLLQQTHPNAGNANSEAVLGQSLAVIGFSWLGQVTALTGLGDQISKILSQYHHGVGIAGQTGINGSGVQSPYVDLPMNFYTLQSQSSSTAQSFTPLVAGSSALSILESGTIEQTQASIPNMEAASTIRIVDKNVQATNVTYFLDGTTAANTAYYTPTTGIRALIVPFYSASDLATIDAAVTASKQVLLPARGNVAIGTAPWIGAGYTIIQETSTSISLAQLISGGLSGGFGGTNAPSSSVNAGTQNAMPAPAIPQQPTIGLITTDPAPGSPKINEPVDAVSGAEVYDHTDLVLGGGGVPYALAFGRTYKSSSNLSDVGMGLGWAHTYGVTTAVNSDPYQALGSGSPISAAAAMVANYVAVDLMSGTRNAQTMTVTAVLQNWFMDQLKGNAVIVSRSDGNEEFIKLADGSFNAPIGSATVLAAGTGSTSYVYTAKDGTKLSFNNVATGSLQSSTYPNGMQVSLTYDNADGSGLLRTVTNNLGRSLTLSYSGTHVSSVSDGSRTVGFGYSGSNLTSAADPLGATTTYTYDTTGTYDASGHLTQIFYPSNPTNPFVTNYYDGLGRVYKQADANGNAWNFGLAGSRTQVTDPLGNRSVTYQTTHGKIIKNFSIIDPAVGVVFGDTVQNNGHVNVVTNQYDGLDRMTLTTAPEGNSVSYTYAPDLRYNVTQIVKQPKPGSRDLSGNLLVPITTTLAYDPTYNQVSLSTDSKGNITSYTYDTPTSSGGSSMCLGSPVSGSGTGDLCKITYPAVSKPGGGAAQQRTRLFTYYARGLVQDATDEEARQIHYDYDANGNRTAVTVNPGGLALKTTYGYALPLIGDVTSIVDPRGNVTGGTPATYTSNFSFDAKRRLIQTFPSALPYNMTRYLYDQDDHRTAVMRFSWLGGGAQPTYATTWTTYTKTGKPQTVTDPDKVITTYAYDPLDRVSTMTGSSGRQTAYGYDTLSRIATITGTVSGTLDPSITSNLGPVLLETRNYTPNGPMATSKDGNNHVTTSIYDGFDRLQKTVYTDTRFDGYEYDTNSNLTKQVNRASDQILLTYDARNRLLTRAVPANPSAPAVAYTYGYDYSGLLMQLQQSTEAAPATYGYDTAARLVSETNPGGKTVTYTLDAAANRVGLAWPEVGALAYQTTSVFDAVNRLTDIYEGAGTAGMHLAHFNFDTLSERTELDYANGNKALYTYQPNSLLATLQQNFSAATSVNFGYIYNTENAVSGRLVSDATYQASASNPALQPGSRAYAANAVNQYTTVAGGAYSYDLNGNLIGDGTRIYGFDPQNRLVSASGGGTTSSYAYDPQQRRAAKTVNAVTTRFLLAGSQEIAEYDGTGTLLRRYVYGPGINEPLATVDAAGTHSYHQADGLGSIVALTNSAGAVTEKHVYTPFGVSDSNTGTPYQFTGQRFDPETGLYYFRARYYSPTLGRFVSMDPIGQLGGINLYAYTGNDPLNRLDPLGLCDSAQCGNASPGNTLITLPANMVPTGFTATSSLSTKGSYQEAAVTISEHGDRHVADPETARLEILRNLPDAGTIGGPFYGITPNYIYRAYPLPNGDLNIGTYYNR